MATVEELVETIGNMKVAELAELVKALEEKFGVTAATPMVQQMMPTAMPGAVPAAGAPAEAAEAAEEKAPAEEEEQTEFNVLLDSYGDQKVKVIKEVRSVTDLGLKEAKEVVESVPVVVKEGVNKEEADQIKEKLEAVGATVQIQ